MPTAASAIIVSERTLGGLMCTIRDTSVGGARIEIRQDGAVKLRPHDLPERFTLVYFSREGRSEVRCAVARRTGSELGVRYVSRLKTASLPGH